MRTGYSRVPWGWPRRVLVMFVAVFLTPVFAVVASQPEAAFGLGVPSASFNVASARNGTALVLTAGTSNDANCVTVSGAHSGTQTVPPLPTKTTSWTFNFTAGLGDGTRTVTVTA